MRRSTAALCAFFLLTLAIYLHVRPDQAARSDPPAAQPTPTRSNPTVPATQRTTRAPASPSATRSPTASPSVAPTAPASTPPATTPSPTPTPDATGTQSP